MTLHINVGGVWKEPTPSINVGGVWKTPDSVHINVGGVWKQVWTGAPVILLTSRTVSATNYYPNAASAGIEINSNGVAYTFINGGYSAISGQWRTGGSSADYQVRATKTSGATPTGSALATWLDCSSSRGWYLNGVGGGFGAVTSSSTLTVEIRLKASPYTVLDTATITLYAEYWGLE